MTVQQIPVFWRVLAGALFTILLMIISFLMMRLHDQVDEHDERLREVNRTQEAVLQRLTILEAMSHNIDDGDRWRATEEAQFQERDRSEKESIRRRIRQLEYINERYGRH